VASWTPVHDALGSQAVEELGTRLNTERKQMRTRRDAHATEKIVKTKSVALKVVRSHGELFVAEVEGDRLT